jgi:xylan 1,4-beta-xylosidase
MYSLKMVLDSSVRGIQTDIGTLASADTHTAAIMVWNYHDEDKQSSGEPITVRIKNIPSAKATVTQYRIDDQHSNSYEVWKKMGSPQNPTKQQIIELEKAGQLQKMFLPAKLAVTNGELTIALSLPRQGVHLIKLDW